MRKYYNYTVMKKLENGYIHHTHIEFEILECSGNNLEFDVKVIAYDTDYNKPLLNCIVEWDAYEESFDDMVKHYQNTILVPLFG